MTPKLFKDYLPGAGNPSLANFAYIVVPVQVDEAHNNTWKNSALLLSNLFANVRMVYIENSDPTVNDDETNGYRVGDRWVNPITGDFFDLSDSTPGAAVWNPPATLPIGTSSISFANTSRILGRITTGGGTAEELTVAQVLTMLGLGDAYVHKGVIDCSASPNYPAADAGHTYRVSVAGKIGGASGPNVEVGDSLICNVDGTVTGTQASVGANWSILQVNLDGVVIGPASSASGNIATFSGTTGKLIQDSGKAVPTGTIVGTTDAQTMSGKTLTNPAETTQALTDGATVNWDMNSGQHATWTIGGNRTLANPTNLKVGGIYTLRVIQDATGNRTITFGAIFHHAPQPNFVANTTTEYVFKSDGIVLFYIGGTQSRAIGSIKITTSATPSYNPDTVRTVEINALSDNITSMTPASNTPLNGQPLIFMIKDANVSKTIAWGPSFQNLGGTLPGSTVAGKWHIIGCVYSATLAKWCCISATTEV